MNYKTLSGNVRSKKEQEFKIMTYTIEEVLNSIDHHKLFVYPCKKDNLSASIGLLESHQMSCINIGKEVATYIDNLEDVSYIGIYVYDFTKKLLENKKVNIDGAINGVVVVYNLGILLEPSLEIKATQLLKDVSKSISLIILWENLLEDTNKLKWPTQENKYALDFSDVPLKRVQYEI